MTFAEAFNAKRELAATVQDNVNVAAPHCPARDLEAIIRLSADSTHAAYPQYAGHWSDRGWKLVKIGRRVETKMGVAFEAGDYALAKKEAGVLCYETRWIAYSIRNGCDTAVSGYGIEEVK